VSFWSGETLVKRGTTLFSPFAPEQIDCNAYNLCIGGQYYRTADEESGSEQTIQALKEKESFVIPAGQFAFLLSREKVTVPKNAMAFISMRTSIKFQGLINVSGFHVDPGYSGRLVYAVYNASPSPIHLAEGDQTFKIWFCDIDGDTGPSFGKSGLSEITSDMLRGMNREIFSLQRLAEKVRGQDQLIETKFAEQKPVIDNLSFVWRALQIGVLVFILAAIVPTAFKLGEQIKNLLWPATLSQQESPSSGQPTANQPEAPTQ
jgi:dCTP deaminase